MHAHGDSEKKFKKSYEDVHVRNDPPFRRRCGFRVCARVVKLKIQFYFVAIQYQHFFLLLYYMHLIKTLAIKTTLQQFVFIFKFYMRMQLWNKLLSPRRVDWIMVYFSGFSFHLKFQFTKMQFQNYFYIRFDTIPIYRTY